MPPISGNSPEGINGKPGLRTVLLRLREKIGGEKETLRQDAIHLSRELAEGFVGAGSSVWERLARQIDEEPVWDTVSAIAQGRFHDRVEAHRDGRDYVSVTWFSKAGLVEKIRGRRAVYGQMVFAIKEIDVSAGSSQDFTTLAKTTKEKRLVPLQARFGGTELWFFGAEASLDNIIFDVSMLDENEGLHQGFYKLGKGTSENRIELVDHADRTSGFMQKITDLDFELTDGDGISNVENYRAWVFDHPEAVKQERRLLEDVKAAAADVFVQLGYRCYFQDNTVGNLDPSLYEIDPSGVASPWDGVNDAYQHIGVKVRLKDLQGIGRIVPEIETFGADPPQQGKDAYKRVTYYRKGEPLYSLIMHVWLTPEGQIQLRPFLATLFRERLHMQFVDPDMKNLNISPVPGQTQGDFATQLDTTARHISAIDGRDGHVFSVIAEPIRRKTGEDIQTITIYDRPPEGQGRTGYMKFQYFPDLYLTGWDEKGLMARDTYVGAFPPEGE